MLGCLKKCPPCPPKSFSSSQENQKSSGVDRIWRLNVLAAHHEEFWRENSAVSAVPARNPPHPADFLRTSTEPSVSGAPGGFLCTGTDSRRRIGEPTEVLRDDRQDKNGRELEREGAKIFCTLMHKNVA